MKHICKKATNDVHSCDNLLSFIISNVISNEINYMLYNYLIVENIHNMIQVIMFNFIYCDK